MSRQKFNGGSFLVQSKEMRRKHLSLKDVSVYLLLAFLLVAVLTFGFNAIGGLPEFANHFGFALPGDNGLPFRISYLNRDFINPITCAGADWCKDGNPRAFVDGVSPPLCHHKQDLQKNGEWPLVQAGSIFTMLPGSPYPIMVSQANYGDGQGKVTVIYVIKAKDCYVSYGLSGGW
jgi:hypothetical protein